MKPWSERFPSRFLTVDDIRKAGGEIRATVTAVKDESMRDLENETEVQKAILVCDTCKPIVVGKVVSKVLISAYGDDPAACTGKTVIAFPYPYKGKDIVMLRCLVNGQSVTAPTPSAPPDLSELNAANAELARVKAELAAQKAKGGKKGKK